jgi:hypothetical protein
VIQGGALISAGLPCKIVLNVSNSREIDAAFATFVHERPDALFVSGEPLFTNRRVQLILLATRHAVPATYAGRQFPDIGGLMVCAQSLNGQFQLLCRAERDFLTCLDFDCLASCRIAPHASSRTRRGLL